MKALDEGRVCGGVGRRVYEGWMLFCLMWPATGGAWALGSTRTWGEAVGLLAGFMGVGLFGLRGLVFRRTPAWEAPPGFWVLAGTGLYVAVRALHAAAPYAAGWEVLRWGCLVGAYLAWGQLGGEGGRWRWVLAVVLCVTALEAVYALHQALNHSTGVLWMTRPEQYGMRASGSYLCPNHFGNLLAMMVPMAVGLVCMRSAGMALRLIGGYYVLLSLPALYFSQSRSAWLGLLAGLLTMPLLLAWRRSKVLFCVGLVALPLVGAGAGWVAYETLPVVKARFGGLWEDPTKASAGRLKVWRDAPAMFKAAPVWGHGPGSYRWVYPRFKRHVKDVFLWDYPHNEWIQFGLEQGVVGWILLGVVLGVVGVRYLGAEGRAWDGSGAVMVAGVGGCVVCCLVHGFFDFNFHIFPNPHALALLAGTGWSAWRAEERGEPEGYGGCVWGAWVRRGAGLVVVGLCLVGGWVTVRRGMSYGWVVRGEAAMEAVRWEEAEGAYRRAARWARGNPDAVLGLGRLRLTRAMWFFAPGAEERRAGKRELAEGAIVLFRRGGALNPCDMGAVMGEARALDMVGREEEALVLFRRAAAYEPTSVYTREQVGLQLRRMKRYGEALAWFEAAEGDGVIGPVGRANLAALRKKRGLGE